LTFLPSWLGDFSVNTFEGLACKKRSALLPGKEEAFLANEAYLKDVGLTPPDMYECRSDPSIMADWKNGSDVALKSCARKYSDVNALFGRCLPVEMTILEPAERDWVLFEMPTIQYDTLPWRVREEMTIVSPAQNFAVAFKSVKKSTELWIKGSKYSIDNLVGSEIGGEWSTFIFRLTPRQYHRFHVPVTGKVVNMVFLGSRHLSVQPALLQTGSTNVLTENVRVVLTIETNYFKTVQMVIVGATCVFSILFSNPQLQAILLQAIQNPGQGQSVPNILIRKRQALGRFRYGSTIVLLVTESPNIGLSTHLVLASLAKIETEIRVGQPVAFSVGAKTKSLLDSSTLPLGQNSFGLCPIIQN